MFTKNVVSKNDQLIMKKSCLKPSILQYVKEFFLLSLNKFYILICQKAILITFLPIYINYKFSFKLFGLKLYT